MLTNGIRCLCFSDLTMIVNWLLFYFFLYESVINWSLFYLVIYILANPYRILREFIEDKEYYKNLYNRIISVINAIICIYNVFSISNYSLYMDLNYTGTDSFISGLYGFAIYLFIDGIYNTIKLIKNPSADTLTFLLHHYVGGLGIFLIARQRQGLGLGLYFAATEISTPFLHLSWLLYINKIEGLARNIVFIIFYLIFMLSRIFTIPVLCYYLWYNSNNIAVLTPFHYLMVYLGSLTLIILNLVWFFMLTKILSTTLLCHTHKKIKRN